jgi:hypothetical protein
MIQIIIPALIGVGIYKLFFEKDEQNETLSENGPDISGDIGGSQSSPNDSEHYRGSLNDAKSTNISETSRGDDSSSLAGESERDSANIDKGVSHESIVDGKSSGGGGDNGGIENDAKRNPAPSTGGKHES